MAWKFILKTTLIYCATSALNLCVCALLAWQTAGANPSFMGAFAAYWLALGVLRPYRLALAAMVGGWW